MSYVYVCEGIKAIKEVINLSPVSGAREFFGKSGIMELKERLLNEREAKLEAAPSYELGWANGWGEKQRAKYEELKQLMDHGKIYNSQVSGESMHGYNYRSGEIVDDNGNLIATFGYGVDSSD